MPRKKKFLYVSTKKTENAPEHRKSNNGNFIIKLYNNDLSNRNAQTKICNKKYMISLYKSILIIYIIWLHYSG